MWCEGGATCEHAPLFMGRIIIMQKKTTKGMRLAAAVSMALLGLSGYAQAEEVNWGTEEKPISYEAYTALRKEHPADKESTGAPVFTAAFSENIEGSLEGKTDFDFSKGMEVEGNNYTVTQEQAGDSASWVVARGVDAAGGLSDAKIHLGSITAKGGSANGIDGSSAKEIASGSAKEIADGSAKILGVLAGKGSGLSVVGDGVVLKAVGGDGWGGPGDARLLRVKNNTGMTVSLGAVKVEASGGKGSYGGNAVAIVGQFEGADGLCFQAESLKAAAVAEKDSAERQDGVNYNTNATGLDVWNSRDVTIDISSAEVKASGGAGKDDRAIAQGVILDNATGTLKATNIAAIAEAGQTDSTGKKTGNHVGYADAAGVWFSNSTIDVTGEMFNVCAKAQDAGDGYGNVAYGIYQNGGTVTYTVGGEMAVQAFAGVNEAAAAQSNSYGYAICLKNGVSSITAESLRAEAGATAFGDGDSIAVGLDFDGNELTIHAQGDISCSGKAGPMQSGDDTQVARGKSIGVGFQTENAAAQITTSGAVKFSGSQDNKNCEKTAEAYGAAFISSKIKIEADKGIYFSAANAKKFGAAEAQFLKTVENGGAADTVYREEYSFLAVGSTVDLYGGNEDEAVTFNGDVLLEKNSTMRLRSNAVTYPAHIGDVKGQGAGDLNLIDSNLVLQNDAKTLWLTSGSLGLHSGNIYFYDDTNPEDKYLGVASHPEYGKDDFRMIDVEGKMVVQGTDNTLYVRSNSLKGDYGDYIVASGTLEGRKGEEDTQTAALKVNVFDEGMKTGYDGKKDGKGWAEGEDGNKTFDGEELNKKVTIITSGGINNLAVSGESVSYDNGVWAYDYDVDVHKDGVYVVWTQVATTKAEASSAQKTSVDANTAAASAAVSFFGADETLHERLGDLRAVKEGSDKENGLWAKYIGGRLKADGLSRDVKVKYNGVEVGYDHYVGNNWTLGVAGEYVDGDTTLTAGSGSVKTKAGALYGTWLGDKGHHLDIIAKVGKVESETSSFGGTIPRQMNGDFDATAYSLAVEYGRKYDLSSDWFITPATRLSYVHMGSAGYDVKAPSTTMHAENDAFNSFILRAGARVGKKLHNGSFYFKLAALYDFDGDTATTITADGRTARYEDDLGGFGVEYGLGFDHTFGNSSVYLDVERISGGDLQKDWGVNVGFRYQF